MPSLILDDRLIWFAHCPKAGGTSVEMVLVDRFGASVGHLAWGWDIWWKDGGWRHADPPNSPQHLIWADAERVLARSPDAVFALVRDPAARMISEYRYQRQKRRGTRLGRSLAYLPFPLWLRLMLRLMRLNPYAFDNHLRPQSDFVPSGAHIFHLEDGLDPVGVWLAAATGQPLDLPVEFPKSLAGRGVVPRMSPRDKALITHIFSEDHARFGYAGTGSGPRARPVLDGLAWVLVWPVLILERRGRL